MSESETEVVTIAAEIQAAPAAPLSIAKRIRAFGDFISQAVAVAFTVALAAVTALAALLAVTLFAPVFLVLFARALRRQEQLRLSRAAV